MAINIVTTLIECGERIELTIIIFVAGSISILIFQLVLGRKATHRRRDSMTVSFPGQPILVRVSQARQ